MQQQQSARSMPPPASLVDVAVDNDAIAILMISCYCCWSKSSSFIKLFFFRATARYNTYFSFYLHGHATAGSNGVVLL